MLLLQLLLLLLLLLLRLLCDVMMLRWVIVVTDNVLPSPPAKASSSFPKTKIKRETIQAFGYLTEIYSLTIAHVSLQ